MINSSSSLWRIHPSSLAAFDPAKPAGRQRIAGPLVDLAALQRVLGSGRFDTDDLVIATDRCERDLENHQWTYENVLQMLVSLVPSSDYRKSEWCRIKGGRHVLCDVYELPYDLMRHQRNVRAEAVYLKFSINETGRLTIVMVSCHPPR